MPRFRSTREKRLWICVAAIVLALYLSLGLARKLAGWLRGQGILEATFVLGILLVMTTVLILAFRRRPGRYEIGAWLGVFTAYLFVLVRMAIPEERTHLIEYGMVGALVYAALLERAQHDSRVKWPALLAILITSLLGAIDEGIQAWLPNRVFDLRDLLFNTLAGVMAVTATALIGWARQLKTNPP